MAMLLKGIKNFFYTWCLTDRQKAFKASNPVKCFYLGFEHFFNCFAAWVFHLSGYEDEESFMDELNVIHNKLYYQIEYYLKRNHDQRNTYFLPWWSCLSNCQDTG